MKKRLFVVAFLLILCLGILLFASCGTVKKSVAKTGTNMSLKLDHAHHLVISSADGELIEVTDDGIVQAISDIFASVVFVDGPSMKETEDAIPQKMLLQLGDDEPISSDRISFNSQTSFQTGQINFLFPKKSEGDIWSEEEILTMLTGAEVTLTVVQEKSKIPADEMQITSEDVKLEIK